MRGEAGMYLELLTKWVSSGSSGCPSVYTTEDPKAKMPSRSPLRPSFERPT
jgi:hypothetical protein